MLGRWISTRKDRRDRAPSIELPSAVRGLPCESHVEHPRIWTTFVSSIASRDAPRAPVLGERVIAAERWETTTNCRATVEAPHLWATWVTHVCGLRALKTKTRFREVEGVSCLLGLYVPVLANGSCSA